MQVIYDIDSIINLCNRGWSQQYIEVVLAFIINIIDTIWHCRNQAWFNDNKIKFQIVVNHMCASIVITDNDTRSPASSSI